MDYQNALLAFIQNIYVQLKPIAIMLNNLSVVLAFAFFARALFKLKHLADFRNMMHGGQAEIGKTLMLIVVGTFFMWLPFLVRQLHTTFFADFLPNGQCSQYWNDFFAFTSLIGVVSIMRSLILFSSATQGQAQQGTMGKAISHLVGGIMLYNLNDSLSVLLNLFGYSWIGCVVSF